MIFNQIHRIINAIIGSTHKNTFSGYEMLLHFLIVPDTCERGYYGPLCTAKCHCANDSACIKLTGECPQRECAEGYSVPAAVNSYTLHR